MKPQISIIVPIYKAEAYIRRCLDSILAQTFTDWEAILVDDGSPDRSGEICDDYAKRDNRFKVIHKENGGVASARQAGIDHASGEYSIHCDPDDWAEPDWLSALYDKAKEDDADMVICDFYIERREGQISFCERPFELNPNTVLKQILSHNLYSTLWNRLIRHRLYKDFNIFFPKKMNLAEDSYVVVSFLRHHIKIGYVPKALYHYIRMSNNNSLSQSLSKNTIDSLIYYTDYISDLAHDDEFSAAVEYQKCITKTRMWYSQHYPVKYFKRKYSEIDSSLKQKCKENGSQTKSLRLALSGWGGVILATFIEKTRKFRR